MDDLNAQLQDQRIRSLEQYAADARGVGDWNREIAALNAWGRLQGERTVEPMLATARQNQQHANLYDQALEIAASDPGAAGELLRMLYHGAPNYGDPRGLAARLGVSHPAPQPQAASRPQAARQPAPAPQPEPQRVQAPPPRQPVEPISPGTIQRPGANPLLMYVIFGGLGLIGGGPDGAGSLSTRPVFLRLLRRTHLPRLHLPVRGRRADRRSGRRVLHQTPRCRQIEDSDARSTAVAVHQLQAGRQRLCRPA
ncbi:MAG: hypothetical protein HND48_17075 [Chloroflexi bacterium]|nr:hypothetical protein [Chloroflexota bacterium]